MAWMNEHSQFNFGPYKGKKVSEVTDAAYIKGLHDSGLNVYFTDEVLDRLRIVPENNAPRRKTKTSQRYA